MAFIGRGQEGEEEKLMFYSIYFSCIQKQAIKSLGRKLKRGLAATKTISQETFNVYFTFLFIRDPLQG